MDLGKWSFGARANVICFVQEEQCTNDRGIHEVKLGVYSDLKDKIVEITTAKQNKEKRMKRIEDSLRAVSYTHLTLPTSLRV